MDDQALVVQARAGDAEAYRQIVARYQTVAFRAAYLIVRDASEAEDVVQEAFVNAFDALGTFRDDAPLRPWLLRIVTNEARNRLRARTRRLNLLQRAAQQRLPEQHEPSPETLVLDHESQGTLSAAVGALGEHDRVVIAYRYYLDLSIAEIAAILDCPERTVRSRLRRALERLERQLSSDPSLRELAREPTDHGAD